MAHNRKIVFSGISLTMARPNRHDLSVMGEIMDEMERVMISSRYLDNAPFKWVGLVLRYGLKNEIEPHYQRINKKYGDLPLAIELDTHELQHASREELKELFLIATLKTLVHVGKKYKLPHDRFAEMLAELQAARARGEVRVREQMKTFCEQLAAMFIDVKNLLAAHLVDHDELFPHILMAGVTRYVLEDRRQRAEIVQHLENTFSKANKGEHDLIGVSFLGNIKSFQDLNRALAGVTGNSLRREWHRPARHEHRV